MGKQKVFISSVQKEFMEERIALYNHFLSDALLSSFFEPILFEKLPANPEAPEKVYLNEVSNSKVYVVLLGVEYGYEDENGVSPTELEYNYAKKLHKKSFAFIKGASVIYRHPKNQNFINRVQNHLSYKRFETVTELISEIDKAFVGLLKKQGQLQIADFDDAINMQATLEDIDNEKVDDFISIARKTRNFPLREGTPVEMILRKLHLYANNHLTNSALLVFGKDPQRFTASALVKCAHFHGLEVEKPIPDHRVINGDVFKQVNEAVDFVLSKIRVSVGVRDESNRAPIKYEIPRAVVAEAIVNAVAHREYSSNGSIQVMLFANRLEIVNPGGLVSELSLEKLKSDHGSYPTNPKLAEVLYQTGYIERYGTGTGEIYRLSKDAGLKEPEFDLEEGFKIIIWRPSTIHDTVHDTIHVHNEIGNLAHRLVFVMQNKMSREEIMRKLDLKNRSHFVKNYLEPAISSGLTEMTLPDKPKSKNQKYRLTKKGISLNKKLKNEYK